MEPNLKIVSLKEYVGKEPPNNIKLINILIKYSDQNKMKKKMRKKVVVSMLKENNELIYKMI